MTNKCNRWHLFEAVIFLASVPVVIVVMVCTAIISFCIEFFFGTYVNIIGLYKACKKSQKDYRIKSILNGVLKMEEM